MHVKNTKGIIIFKISCQLENLFAIILLQIKIYFIKIIVFRLTPSCFKGFFFKELNIIKLSRNILQIEFMPFFETLFLFYSHLFQLMLIFSRMLVDNNVQERLLLLLKTEHMASSLKLLILRALDSTTNCSAGMENFLGWNEKVG